MKTFKLMLIEIDRKNNSFNELEIGNKYKKIEALNIDRGLDKALNVISKVFNRTVTGHSFLNEETIRLMVDKISISKTESRETSKMKRLGNGK